MKIQHSILFLVLINQLFTSCTSENTVPVKFTGETQGTYYAITYFDNDARNFQSQVDSILKVIDQSVSLWAPGSIISRINRGEENVVPDEIFMDLFKMSEEEIQDALNAFNAHDDVKGYVEPLPNDN